MQLLVLLSCVVLIWASEDFTTANNKFATKLYTEISKNENGNFLFSPFSAETVLTLTQEGAKGLSQQQIHAALYLPNDTIKTHEEVKVLLPALKGNNGYTLHIVNKMYIKENFTVRDDFKKVATEIYSAGVENVDFLKNEETAGIINNWVEKQTENKIRNLLSSDLLNHKTRLVLINALYFKSNWSHPFLLTRTRKIDFYKTPSDIVKVDAMHDHETQTFLYFECHHLNAKFLELPLEGVEASLTIILPNEQTGLPTLESRIDQALLPHNVTRQLVNVAIPKFKIESTVNLKNILQNLGVTTIFTDFESDLSGIAGEKGDLVVSEVVQKTFIDVNEEGVEAAAATFTIVGVPKTGLEEEPPKFIADHPFLFYIKLKGVIIFVGRVADPTL